MKSFFENRTWPDEISFWEYIQTIDTAPDGTPDGIYVIEMDSDIGCVKFQEAFYFATDEEEHNCFYDRELVHIRVVFIIKQNILTIRLLEGHEISATDCFEDESWVNSKYIDLFERLHFERKKFTKEECELAVKEILKLMIIESKKVG